jgi:hypothetical protein
LTHSDSRSPGAPSTSRSRVFGPGVSSFSGLPVADVLTLTSGDRLVKQPNDVIAREVEVTHRLRRGIVVTGDDCIAIEMDEVFLFRAHRRSLQNHWPRFCGIHLLALFDPLSTRKRRRPVAIAALGVDFLERVRATRAALLLDAYPLRPVRGHRLMVLPLNVRHDHGEHFAAYVPEAGVKDHLHHPAEPHAFTCRLKNNCERAGVVAWNSVNRSQCNRLDTNLMF